MNDHYQVNNQEWAKLGWSIEKAYYAMDEFGKCGGLIGLMHYVDRHKNLENPLAQAIFNSLEAKDKITILQYIELAKASYPDEALEDFDFQMEIPPDVKSTKKKVRVRVAR